MSFQNSGVGSSQLNFQQNASHCLTPQLHDQLVLLNWKISQALSYQLNQFNPLDPYEFLKARNQQIKQLVKEFDRLEISKKLSSLNAEQQEEMELIFQVWSNRVLLEKRFIWFRAVVDKEFARFLNKEGDHNRQAFTGYLHGLGHPNRLNNELSLVEHLDFVEHLDSVEPSETAKEPETGAGSGNTSNELREGPETGAGSRDTNNEPKEEPETETGSGDTNNEPKEEPKTVTGSGDTNNELKEEPKTVTGSGDTNNELKEGPEVGAGSGDASNETGAGSKKKKGIRKKVLKKIKKLFTPNSGSVEK